MISNFQIFENLFLKAKVKLDFPELRQVYDYDCGVSCLQQVLIYYGIEKREDELINLLSIKKSEMIKYGIKLSKIKDVANYYGLESEILKNTTIKKIKELIDDGIPPILLIQAWRDFSVDNSDWKKDYSDGHYVVAIGYNDKCIFFEDPSTVVRTYLTYDELEKRWHDVDGENKVSHAVVVIKGEKKFNSSDIVHMD